MNTNGPGAKRGETQTEHSTDRTKTNANKGVKTQRKIFRLFFTVIAIALIFGVVLAIPMFNKGASRNALIKVPAGATKQNVEDSIAKYLGSDYAHDTRRAIEIFISGEPLRHGAFMIEKGTSPMRAARKIVKGGQAGIRLTFFGERTKEELAEKVAAKLDIKAQDMIDAMNDPVLLTKYRTDPDHVIALFLDDTYEFFWVTTPEKVIAKMRENYDRFWHEKGRFDKAESMRLSTRDVVALASIVDEETNRVDEKGRIGRLYLNRLNKGMKLQADPTVKYAIGDFTVKRITKEMLSTPSPYNTYLNQGLPPGPIRTTSGLTIDAILNSSPSDEIYMCAKEDFSGYHNFATDYETHLANARRYQAELDRRGIR